VGSIGLYQRDAKDPTTTMRLPLRQHLHYAAQGFLLVKIDDSDDTSPLQTAATQQPKE